MKFLAVPIATVLGLGFFPKGSGTLTSAVVCLAYFYLFPEYPSLLIQVVFLLIIAAVFFVGVWSSTVAEQQYGHDPSCVVIDEVAGMMTALIAIPHSWAWVGLSFALFRLMDITKWLGSKQAERLPRGWGVMTDDMVAGGWAFLFLQCYQWYNNIS